MKLSEFDFESNWLSDEQLEKLIFSQRHETVSPCDFAIVLGTEASRAKKRAKMGADFYRKGGAPKIIVSGAPYQDDEGTRKRECDIMRDTLLSEGVPQEAILMEDKARNTAENMIFSYALAVENSRNDFAVGKVAIVTESCHMWRSLILAKLFMPSFVDVIGYATDWDEQKQAFREGGLVYRNCRTEPLWLLKGQINHGQIADIEIE